MFPCRIPALADGITPSPNAAGEASAAQDSSQEGAGLEEPSEELQTNICPSCGEWHFQHQAPQQHEEMPGELGQEAVHAWQGWAGQGWECPLQNPGSSSGCRGKELLLRSWCQADQPRVEKDNTGTTSLVS